jgi:hypothetical protein
MFVLVVVEPEGFINLKSGSSCLLSKKRIRFSIVKHNRKSNKKHLGAKKERRRLVLESKKELGVLGTGAKQPIKKFPN